MEFLFHDSRMVVAVTQLSISIIYSVTSIDDTFILSEECAQYITSEIAGRTILISADEKVSAEDIKQWVKCGGIILRHKDKLVLINGKMLTNMHIN